MSPARVPSAAERPAYHHGNLRRALVDGALSLLADTQRWDFSLREVARRAGVSHNAPYAHFADKRDLLAAVAEHGFDALRQRMLEASTDAADAADALRAIGTAYVMFGLENPAHYRLMFSSVISAEGSVPAGLAQAADAARSVLDDVVREGAQDGRFAVGSKDGASFETAVLAAWSLVHGLTTLMMDGLAAQATTSTSQALLAGSITRTLLAGLVTR